MIFHHLLRMSLENLAARFGRTLFLVLGVAVGTGTLAFLIATYNGMDSLVQTNLDAYRSVFAERTALADKQDELIGSLPVNLITIRPASSPDAENFSEDQLKELRELEGVERVDPVAILFPVITGIKVNFAMAGVFSPDTQQEFKLPTTVYGVHPSFIPEEELIPGERFEHIENESKPVPVVLPAEFLGFINNMNSPEMLDRFSEVVYAEIKKAMNRSERVKRRMGKSLARFGASSLTAPVVKKVIRDMVGKFLSNITEENLPRNFTLRLFPGLDTETMAVPIQVVGYSRKLPGMGLGVPLPYLERWNREFQEETAGILTKLLAGDPEVTYSELHIQTGGFKETVAIAEILRERGFKVESAAEEAERLEAELQSLSGEAERLKAEAGRMRDLSDTLSRGTLVFSVLLFLLAGTVIGNGLSLSVLEQQRRIGILRAVGARRVDILTIFLFEAALIGALGALVGLGLAHAALWLFGSQLSAGLAAGDMPAADLFHISFATNAAIFALGVGFSFVAGIVPAMKAAWIRPIEVLKH
ncbi:MAG: FtsX-like permease family protein [Planctomycetota bacterium]|nr:FtsX-like permease family protein [Planctomycetota bacterium]